MTEMTEKLCETNGQWLEFAVRLSALALQNQKQIAEHQAVVASKLVETGNKQLDLVKAVQDPAELIDKSSDLATELGHELVVLQREALELQTEFNDAMASAIEDEIANGFRTEKKAA